MLSEREQSLEIIERVEVERKVLRILEDGTWEKPAIFSRVFDVS
ncbi:hypothetical protein [Ammoniphilus sp. 3BR4]